MVLFLIAAFFLMPTFLRILGFALGILLGTTTAILKQLSKAK